MTDFERGAEAMREACAAAIAAGIRSMPIPTDPLVTIVIVLPLNGARWVAEGPADG